MIDFAAATDRSTPGFERHRIGDWVLRSASGVTGRANSATLHGDPRRPIAAAVDALEAWYRARGVEPRVMVWAETGAQVQAELARRGYAGGPPTDVMAAPLERVWSQLAAPGRLATRLVPDPPELLRDLMAADRLAEIVHNDLDPVFAVASDGTTDIGTGMALLDPPLIGIFVMRTSEDRQGEGAGRAIVRELLAGAADRGCGTAWLQVENDNHRARDWYGRLGFVARTRYAYWTTPAAVSPTHSTDDCDDRPGSGG